MATVTIVDLHPRTESLLAEVTRGLAATPRTLPPKLFYDRVGSTLFDEITRLDEYYLTRTEMGILTDRSEELRKLMSTVDVLIEFGSGSSRKTRLLLDAARPGLTYMPVDISLESLELSAAGIGRDYPQHDVIAVCGDYTAELELPPTRGARLIFFPGSSIGNFEPAAAGAFFRSIGSLLRPGDGILLGFDLKKDPAILHAAYNDSRGVTAEFNLNMLRRINNELEGDFAVDAFRHVAFYNEDYGRIEMHLESTVDQIVRVGGEQFAFRAGERIHTENSYKYSVEQFDAIAEAASLSRSSLWTDPRRYFAVALFRR